MRNIKYISLLCLPFILGGCNFGSKPPINDGNNTKNQYRSRYQGKIEKFELDRISLKKDIFGGTSSKSKREVIKTDSCGNTLETLKIDSEEYLGASHLETYDLGHTSGIDRISKNMEAWISNNKDRYMDVGKTLDNLGINPNQFYYYPISEEAKHEKELPMTQYQMYKVDLEEGKKANHVEFYLVNEYENGEIGYGIDTLDVDENDKIHITSLGCSFEHPIKQNGEGPTEFLLDRFVKCYYYTEVYEGKVFRTYTLHDIPSDLEGIVTNPSEVSLAVKGDDGNWKVFSENSWSRSLSIQAGGAFYTFEDEISAYTGDWFNSESVIDMNLDCIMFKVTPYELDFDLSPFSFAYVAGKRDTFDPRIVEGKGPYYFSSHCKVFDEDLNDVFGDFKLNFDDTHFAALGHDTGNQFCVQMGESCSIHYESDENFEVESRLTGDGVIKMLEGELGYEIFQAHSVEFTKENLETLLNEFPLEYRSEEIVKEDLIKTLTDFAFSSFDEVSENYEICNPLGSYGSVFNKFDEIMSTLKKEDLVRALRQELITEEFPDITELLPLEPLEEGPSAEEVPTK